jgi:hypothetical protein
VKNIRSIGLLCLALALVTGGLLAENTVAVDEVLKLKAAGLGEDTIVAFVKGKNLNYDLSSDNVIALRDKGLSSAVVNAMLTSGPDSAATATLPAAAAVQQPPTSPTYPVFPGQPVPQTAPAVLQPVPGPPPALSADAAAYSQELSPYGRWILAEDSRWYWQPTVAVATPTWRPYWDNGHWVYSEQGWYWASDYPWGGIAFHYGRWHLHPRHGWVWLPDRTWGPAWVVWRSGGDYCGWAPLPPGAIFDTVAGGFIFRGRHVEVGFDFGLDWHHFGFCLVKDMGERPVLRFRSAVEIQTVFRQTAILNRYAVERPGHGPVRIINRGIEPGHVASARGHAVETVKIREVQKAPPGRSRERVDTRRKTIEVYRRH